MIFKINEMVPFLEKAMDLKIFDYSIAPLTAEGDNFGSTMLSVTLKVKSNRFNDDIKEVGWF